jgi:uncharacterized membrane protein
MGRRIVGYFLNGLLITLPLAVILYVFYNLFISLDDILLPLLNVGVENPEEYRFRGAGVIILLILVTTIGFFGSSLIGRLMEGWFSKLLDRIPLVKTMYTAVNDLLSAFVGKKKRFNQPVLVKMSQDSNLEKIGFITDSDLEHLGAQEGKVAVYFPHSYAFSGNLYIVSIQQITPIDKAPSDVMKYIVSGGVSDLEDKADD